MNIRGVGQTHSNLMYIYSDAQRKGVNLTKEGVNLKKSRFKSNFKKKKMFMDKNSKL